jgi:SAM-dependent methyltransferase
MAVASKKIRKRLPRPSHPGKVYTDETKHDGFDLKWNDEQLFPDVLYPDAEFLLNRMNEATIECMNLDAGEIIVDIGCGRCIEGVNMAMKGAVVIGIEPSLTMIDHALNNISQNKVKVSLVRGIGESLPFQAATADKVLCKGALDHFPRPDEVIRQMALVLKPEGRGIIAVANFGSLGFKVGRSIWWLRKKLGSELPKARMLWEIPDDHTFRMDYSFLKRLVRDCFEVEQVSGVSMLFGLPWWGIFLARLPRNIATGILKSLDGIARHLPALSDVVILICKPREEIQKSRDRFLNLSAADRPEGLSLQGSP